MQRQIRQVRRSIRKRRTNPLEAKKLPHRRPQEALISEEDRHGEPQLYPSQAPLSLKKRQVFSLTVLKGGTALFIFLLSFLVFKTNLLPLEVSKDWLERQLTKDFPFATVNAWYDEKFGRPLAFNPQLNPKNLSLDRQALPVLGEVSEPFHLNGEGIKISSEVATPVKAWEDGIVIFSGNDRSTKRTITIQHADRSESSYGFLSTIDVHLYQYVAAGQVIGMFHPKEEDKEIYFSIEKDDAFLDPVQVMQVNER